MSATGDDGFTLLELLVTMAILALITGIGFPALQTSLSGRDMTEARAAVMLAVTRARSEALRLDLPTQVTLAGPGNALNVSRLAATPLPAGAALEWPARGVTMFGDGSSSGATGVIRIRAGAMSSRFVIDPATARLVFGS